MFPAPGSEIVVISPGFRPVAPALPTHRPRTFQGASAEPACLLMGPEPGSSLRSTGQEPGTVHELLAPGLAACCFCSRGARGGWHLPPALSRSPRPGNRPRLPGPEHRVAGGQCVRGVGTQAPPRPSPLLGTPKAASSPRRGSLWAPPPPAQGGGSWGRDLEAEPRPPRVLSPCASLRGLWTEAEYLARISEGVERGCARVTPFTCQSRGGGKCPPTSPPGPLLDPGPTGFVDCRPSHAARGCCFRILPSPPSWAVTVTQQTGAPHFNPLAP